jgi:hypothetical protein
MTDLTQARLRELLNYDPETGVFTWRVPRGPSKAGQVAGSFDRLNYVCIHVDGKQYKAHRLAWLYVHGDWPAFTIDHINRDASDNRIANLRDVTHSINMRNTGVRRDSTCGLRGVAPVVNSTKWRAYYYADGKQVNIGCFETAQEAADARQRALEQAA